MYRKIIMRSISKIGFPSNSVGVLRLSPTQFHRMTRFQKNQLFRPSNRVFRVYRKKGRDLYNFDKDEKEDNGDNTDIYNPGDKKENYIPTAEVDREKFFEEFQVTETESIALEEKDSEYFEEEYRKFYETVGEEHQKDRKIVYYLVFINVLVFLLFNLRYFLVFYWKYDSEVLKRAKEVGIDPSSESLSLSENKALEEIKRKAGEKAGSEYYAPKMNSFVTKWGMSIPNLTRRPWTVITSTFMHGGWGHLVSNMLFLTIFGRRLRGRLRGMTWKKFAALYIGGSLGGSALSLMHKEFMYRKTGEESYRLMPSVGASGGVYTIMGANMLYTIRTSSFYIQFYIYRAVIYEVMQFLSQSKRAGKGSAGGKDKDMVDHSAHVGGVIFSVVFFLLDLLDFF